MSELLQQEIDRLSATEKLDLLDILWESLESESIQLTSEQQSELDIRQDRYRQNPSDVRTWKQVESDLHKQRL